MTPEPVVIVRKKVKVWKSKSVLPAREDDLVTKAPAVVEVVKPHEGPDPALARARFQAS